jgi:hypothetical protein
VPFPIPSNGKEAMWNHLLAWKGALIHDPIYSMQITTSGEKIIRAQGNLMRQFPYYFQMTRLRSTASTRSRRSASLPLAVGVRDSRLKSSKVFCAARRAHRLFIKKAASFSI